jgi:hypothetical protein
MPTGGTAFLRRLVLIAVVAACTMIVRDRAGAAEQADSDSKNPSAVQLAAQDREFEKRDSTPGKSVLTPGDKEFLDDLEKRGIAYFVEEADPTTGLMPDRAAATGGAKDVASVAAVGFGLTALCIGDERGWVKHQDAYDRALKVLRFLRDKAPQERGHFYHFLNMRTGARTWNCEVSNIDTALLMAGVLTVRQHFANTELSALANELYERVDWPWLLTDNGMLSMGWKPESGFLGARWDQYNECPLVYLLGLGSRTHPLPPESWRAWRRQPVITYAGLSFLQCPPLFTHQYPQAWFDLREMRDDYADYFRNAQLATIAQRQWCIDVLSHHFNTYGPNLWGITASDGPRDYQAWGGPPKQGDIDGSVVPAAAAGSLAFEPRLCLDTLMHMKEKFGEKAYLKYGFVDAFNPKTGWYNPDVLGIDIGPSVLMAENCQSGFVWKTFMSCPEAGRALKSAGFRSLEAGESKSMSTTSLVNGASSKAGSDTAR